MRTATEIPDKILFTPGPLSTAMSTKKAMLRDLGSRDSAFLDIVQQIRTKLLDIAGVSQSGGFEAILMQGSGTFGVESVISTALPRNGRLLVAINGAYGRRIAHIARVLDISVAELQVAENRPISPADVEAAIRKHPEVDCVAVVHCETTTGLVNPVADIGKVVAETGKMFVVDAMSSFGVLPLDLEATGVDFLITSANKCFEGVPGFAVIIARTTALLESEGRARSVCLDIFSQWEGLESSGQFRFTPPTHAILAFEHALKAFEEEGGVPGRRARYEANRRRLMHGMTRLGFQPYLEPSHQSCIITTFMYPSHPRFSFEALYNLLNDRGFVIYPGKLTHSDCFRIGTVGQVFPQDVENLLVAIAETLDEMGVDMEDC